MTNLVMCCGICFFFTRPRADERILISCGAFMSASGNTLSASGKTRCVVA